LVMVKISYEDKARMETLRKVGIGYRTIIVAKFPEKGWKLCLVKAICKGLISVGQERNESQAARSAENSTNR